MEGQEQPSSSGEIPEPREGHTEAERRASSPPPTRCRSSSVVRSGPQAAPPPSWKLSRAEAFGDERNPSACVVARPGERIRPDDPEARAADGSGSGSGEAKGEEKTVAARRAARPPHRRLDGVRRFLEARSTQSEGDRWKDATQTPRTVCARACRGTDCLPAFLFMNDDGDGGWAKNGREEEEVARWRNRKGSALRLPAGAWWR